MQILKILSLIFLIFSSASLYAANRVALVIGNNNYQQSPLNNPVNDAKAIGKLLGVGGLGFTIIPAYNVDRNGMEDALDKFGELAEQAEIAIVYYAGHAIQVDGVNYLIPVNTPIKNRRHLRKLMDLKELVKEAQQAKGLGLVILDACRDNPFSQNLQKSLGRSIGGRGLARIEDTPSNILVGFATKENSVASDGQDTNHSPYATALLHYLPQKNLEIRLLFGKVHDAVKQATKQQQQPYTYGSLGGNEWYLAGHSVPKLPEKENTETITPKPAEKLSRQAFEPKMKLIQGGTFQMGCVSGLGCYKNEKVHKVSIKDFWMGQYEVTFDEWQNCVNDGGCQSNTKPDDEGWGKGQHPVINVTWHDANEYAAWLSKKIGKDYRLPTEAEWEYAARAGTNTKYSFGNNEAELCQYANHADQSLGYFWHNKKCSDGIAQKTAQVGSYQANPWKLYDMMGNVWEWTCSAYPKDNQYNGLESKCTNKNDSRSRELRGGSWYDLPRNVRSANRKRYAATFRNGSVGFRLSRTR